MSKKRNLPPPNPPNSDGNEEDPRLALVHNIAAWCNGSIPAIMDMCDWHVQRPDDGGVLGFKGRKGAKVLAVAHLDYHCSGKVHEANRNRIVSSALDDRLGACLAYNIPIWLGIPLDVVFCDKEETGRSTLPMFGTKMLDKYNWIVEFDRRGEGAVCYQYACMEQPVQKHFTLHQGSFSDICTICHVSPVGAFNMAVGYENEHSETCHAPISAVLRQLKRFKAFYEEFGDVRILHTPPAKTTWQNRQSWKTPRIDDDEDYGHYSSYSGVKTTAPVVAALYDGANRRRVWDRKAGKYIPEVWDPTERAWVKAPATGKTVNDIGGDVLTWDDMSFEDIQFVKELGWEWDATNDLFTKTEKGVRLYLTFDVLADLMLAEDAPVEDEGKATSDDMDGWVKTEDGGYIKDTGYLQ